MTMNVVDASIVGELLLEELPYWDVGVCTIKVKEQNSDILVYGENNHLLTEVSTDVWRDGVLTDDKVKDLEAIADNVNDAIREEHDAL